MFNEESGPPPGDARTLPTLGLSHGSRPVKSVLGVHSAYGRPLDPPPPSKTGHTLNRLLRGGGGVTRARSTTVRRILVQYSGSASSPYMATWSAGEGARRFNLLGRFS